MIKGLIFNYIMTDANPVLENSLDVFLGLITTTTNFHRTIANIKIQTFECAE
jgi:hypothetical protein